MALPFLYYLDERPVFEAERLCADAFRAGGKDEEERVRSEWAANQKRKTKQNTDRGAELDEQSRGLRKQAFKKMIEELKETKSKELLKQHAEMKQKMKETTDSQLTSHYLMKLRKIEDLMKQDYYLKLNAEGREITQAMGKPQILSSKKFIENIEKKVKSRDEVLAEIMQDKVNLQMSSEKVTVIEDSDDPHQNGIWSEDQQDSDSVDEDIVVKDLSQVKWNPNLEEQLEAILISSGFDFNLAANEF